MKLILTWNSNISRYSVRVATEDEEKLIKRVEKLLDKVRLLYYSRKDVSDLEKIQNLLKSIRELPLPITFNLDKYEVL